MKWWEQNSSRNHDFIPLQNQNRSTTKTWPKTTTHNICLPMAVNAHRTSRTLNKIDVIDLLARTRTAYLNVLKIVPLLISIIHSSYFNSFRAATTQSRDDKITYKHGHWQSKSESTNKNPDQVLEMWNIKQQITSKRKTGAKNPKRKWKRRNWLKKKRKCRKKRGNIVVHSKLAIYVRKKTKIGRWVSSDLPWLQKFTLNSRPIFLTLFKWPKFQICKWTNATTTPKLVFLTCTEIYIWHMYTKISFSNNFAILFYTCL